jgi:hypothetical protein
VNTPYKALADIVLAAHFSIVLFVIGGLIIILVGNLFKWSWVNRMSFRVTHLAAILFVVAESWLGITCPLTTLEIWLRKKAGVPAFEKSFIEHWVHKIMFFEAPTWVFTLCYTLFAILVVLTWWLFPPNRVFKNSGVWRK